MSLGQRFAAGPQDPGPLDRAVDLLRRAAGPGADLTEVRRLPRGQRLARWSPRRRHAPPATGPALWPFDPEVLGLVAGTRRLLKREVARGDDADTETARLVARGLAVRAVDTGEAAVSPRRAGGREGCAAKDAERALGRGDDADAVRHLGEASVTRPAAWRRSRTWAATTTSPSGPPASPPRARPRRRPRPSGSSPPWPWCPRPLRPRLRGHLGPGRSPPRRPRRRLPGLRRPLAGLARRLHLVDREGRAFSLALEPGPLDGGRVVDACTWPSTLGPGRGPPGPRGDLAGARVALSAAGVALRGPAPSRPPSPPTTGVGSSRGRLDTGTSPRRDSARDARAWSPTRPATRTGVL